MKHDGIRTRFSAALPSPISMGEGLGVRVVRGWGEGS
jgi:hypothetical protein